MRFAFLTTSCNLFIERMRPLADMLKGQGHSCKVFAFLDSGKDVGYPLHMGNWHDFEIQPIINFDPHLIITWNGYFPSMVGATCYLRTRFRVAIMECGWYTQKKFSYLSDDLSQVSLIRDVPYRDGITHLPHNAKLLEDARSRYDTSLPKDLSLPDKYIFVPRQLEYDTQILITSPRFKTMSSLLGYVRHEYPDTPIVVTCHPMEGKKENPKFTNDMTGKASSIALAFRAERVIGINSTLLAESMLLQKPTQCLGDHVAYNVIGSPLILPGWSERYDYRSLVLIYNQWDYRSPPGWLMDKLNNLDLTPRVPT